MANPFVLPTGLPTTTFPAMQHLGAMPFGSPHPSVYIRGNPATVLTAPPVTPEQQRECERIRHTTRWEHYYSTLVKYISSKIVVPFTGDHGALEHSQWVNSLMNFFELTAIENPAVQALLAVFTFQATAAAWWRAHKQHSPQYTLSFAQLVEWVRTELLPESNPATTVLAWQRLKYAGNIDKFLTDVRGLFVTNLLPTLTALTMVTDQFGPALQSRIQAANAQAGPNGMSMTQWEQIVKDHVLTTEKSRQSHARAVERTEQMLRPQYERNQPPVYTRPPQYTPQQLHRLPAPPSQPSRARMAQLAEDLMAARPWEELGIHEEEWATRLNSVMVVPKDPKTPAVPIKYGEGPSPCFICGSSKHSWVKCEHKRHGGRCAICTHPTHLTMECAHRYHARPEARNQPRGPAVANICAEPSEELVASPDVPDEDPIAETEATQSAPTEDTLIVGAKVCYVNQTPIGDQHAVKALWEAVNETHVSAR